MISIHKNLFGLNLLMIFKKFYLGRIFFRNLFSVQLQNTSSQTIVITWKLYTEKICKVIF